MIWVQRFALLFLDVKEVYVASRLYLVYLYMKVVDKQFAQAELFKVVGKA